MTRSLKVAVAAFVKYLAVNVFIPAVSPVTKIVFEYRNRTVLMTVQSH